MQGCHHSYDATMELHCFNQIIKGLVLSTENKDDAIETYEPNGMPHVKTYFCIH